MDSAAQVHQNLVHYNLWTNVETFRKDEAFSVLRGQPPSKLTDDDPESQLEWVVPKEMHDSTCTMREIEGWFEYISTLSERPKRVTLAVINDDSTVVFYFVHDGVTAPRQN